jgi:site-specific recombinase XerD
MATVPPRGSPVPCNPLSNRACRFPAHGLPMIFWVWLASDSTRCRTRHKGILADLSGRFAPARSEACGYRPLALRHGRSDAEQQRLGGFVRSSRERCAEPGGMISFLEGDMQGANRKGVSNSHPRNSPRNQVQEGSKDILRARLRPINQGRQHAQSTMTVEQFVNQMWRPGVMPTLRFGSSRYYDVLRCHILPAFGARRLCDMTRVNVQCFLADKRTQGFSGSSVHGMRTAISKVLQTAVDWNLLDQNPARGIRIGDRAPKTERPYLNPTQVSRLLASLREPCRTLTLLAVLTGMRIGEILALRWKTIDFDRGVIQIREQRRLCWAIRTSKPRLTSTRAQSRTRSDVRWTKSLRFLFTNVHKMSEGGKTKGSHIDVQGVATTVEPRIGIEPMTCRLRIGCSTS